MFGDGSLTLREFAMGESLPLARIQEAVLGFLRDRSDAVLFGAQAVNAYVDEPRMTQDVDVLSQRASELAEELRAHLGHQFHIAVRIRAVAGARGFRIFQQREPKNRHLVDVRQVAELPPTRSVAGVQVPTPEELVAQKVIAFVGRRGQPKSGTDWRDATLLLQTFPGLKQSDGAVYDRLVKAAASPEVLSAWAELVELPLTPSPDDDGY